MPSKYYLRNFKKGGYYHIYNRGANRAKIFLKPKDYHVFLKIVEHYFHWPYGKKFCKREVAQTDSIKQTNSIKQTKSIKQTDSIKQIMKGSLEENPQPKKGSGNSKKGSGNSIGPRSSFDIVAYCLMPNHFHFLFHQARQPVAEGAALSLDQNLERDSTKSSKSSKKSKASKSSKASKKSRASKSSTQNSIVNFMRRSMIAYSHYLRREHNHSGTFLEGRYKNVLVASNRQIYKTLDYIHRNPLEILKPRQKIQDYRYSSYRNYLGLRSDPWVNTETLAEGFVSIRDEQRKQSG